MDGTGADGENKERAAGKLSKGDECQDEEDNVLQCKEHFVVDHERPGQSGSPEHCESHYLNGTEKEAKEKKSPNRSGMSAEKAPSGIPGAPCRQDEGGPATCQSSKCAEAQQSYKVSSVLESRSSHNATKEEGKEEKEKKALLENPDILPSVRKKSRTSYNAEQLEELERVFQEDPYPDTEKKMELAAAFGVMPKRILVWFQNRRAKWRKLEKLNAKGNRKHPTSSPLSHDYGWGTYSVFSSFHNRAPPLPVPPLPDVARDQSAVLGGNAATGNCSSLLRAQLAPLSSASASSVAGTVASCGEVQAKMSLQLGFNSSRVDSFNSSRVDSFNSSRVDSFNSSRVDSFNSSRVDSFSSSRVDSFSSSRVDSFSSSRVDSFSSSRVDSFNSSRVDSFNSSRVDSFSSSRVDSFSSSRVDSFSSSRVECFPSLPGPPPVRRTTNLSFSLHSPAVPMALDTPNSECWLSSQENGSREAFTYNIQNQGFSPPPSCPYPEQLETAGNLETTYCQSSSQGGIYQLSQYSQQHQLSQFCQLPDHLATNLLSSDHLPPPTPPESHSAFLALPGNTGAVTYGATQGYGQNHMEEQLVLQQSSGISADTTAYQAVPWSDFYMQEAQFSNQLHSQMPFFSTAEGQNFTEPSLLQVPNGTALGSMSQAGKQKGVTPDQSSNQSHQTEPELAWPWLAEREMM